MAAQYSREMTIGCLRKSISMHNTDSSDDDEYISSAGDNFHESDLEGGDSTSGYDELEDPHSANLPSYLLKD